MAVLERSELQASSLADLHAIADQLGLEGFRRLRKADLIEAILGTSADGASTDGGSAAGESTDKGSSARGSSDGGSAAEEPAGDGEPTEDASSADGPRRRSSTRGRRSRRGPAKDADEQRRGQPTTADSPAKEDRLTEGVFELLGTGSAFLRVNPPDASDEDVYISAAQVRRCELVSGDRVTGPLRTPR